MTPSSPRRAYDQNGNEIPPATVASTKAQGMTTVFAFCNECGHDAVVPFKGWPEETPIPDMALKLRCSKCGAGTSR